jgi:hypothetical protein
LLTANNDERNLIIMAQRKLAAATFFLTVISTTAAVIAIFFNGLLNQEGRGALVGKEEPVATATTTEPRPRIIEPSTAAEDPVDASVPAPVPPPSSAVVEAVPATATSGTEITIIDEKPVVSPPAIASPQHKRGVKGGTAYKLSSMPEQVRDTVDLTYESDH